MQGLEPHPGLPFHIAASPCPRILRPPRLADLVFRQYQAKAEALVSEVHSLTHQLSDLREFARVQKKCPVLGIAQHDERLGASRSPLRVLILYMTYTASPL